MFPKTHLQNILNNWIELWDSYYSTSIVYYSNYGTQLKGCSVRVCLVYSIIVAGELMNAMKTTTMMLDFIYIYSFILMVSSSWHCSQRSWHHLSPLVVGLCSLWMMLLMGPRFDSLTCLKSVLCSLSWEIIVASMWWQWVTIFWRLSLSRILTNLMEFLDLIHLTVDIFLVFCLLFHSLFFPYFFYLHTLLLSLDTKEYHSWCWDFFPHFILI